MQRLGAVKKIRNKKLSWLDQKKKAVSYWWNTPVYVSVNTLSSIAIFPRDRSYIRKIFMKCT